MKRSNDIQFIIKEFSGKKCKLKLLTGELIIGTLSEIEQINTIRQTVQVIETSNNEQIQVKTILIRQIDALGLV